MNQVIREVCGYLLSVGIVFLVLLYGLVTYCK